MALARRFAPKLYYRLVRWSVPFPERFCADNDDRCVPGNGVKPGDDHCAGEQICHGLQPGKLERRKPPASCVARRSGGRRKPGILWYLQGSDTVVPETRGARTRVRAVEAEGGKRVAIAYRRGIIGLPAVRPRPTGAPLRGGIRDSRGFDRGNFDKGFSIGGFD